MEAPLVEDNAVERDTHLPEHKRPYIRRSDGLARTTGIRGNIVARFSRVVMLASRAQSHDDLLAQLPVRSP